MLIRERAEIRRACVLGPYKRLLLVLNAWSAKEAAHGWWPVLVLDGMYNSTCWMCHDGPRWLYGLWRIKCTAIAGWSRCT